jgi:hypothetical protein
MYVEVEPKALGLTCYIIGSILFLIGSIIHLVEYMRG